MICSNLYDYALGKTEFVFKKIQISIKKTIESTLIDMEVNNRILKMLLEQDT